MITIQRNEASQNSNETLAKLPRSSNVSLHATIVGQIQLLGENNVLLSSKLVALLNGNMTEYWFRGPIRTRLLDMFSKLKIDESTLKYLAPTTTKLACQSYVCYLKEHKAPGKFKVHF